jgi:hypothetical protein
VRASFVNIHTDVHDVDGNASYSRAARPYIFRLPPSRFQLSLLPYTVRRRVSSVSTTPRVGHCRLQEHDLLRVKLRVVRCLPFLFFPFLPSLKTDSSLSVRMRLCWRDLSFSLEPGYKPGFTSSPSKSITRISTDRRLIDPSVSLLLCSDSPQLHTHPYHLHSLISANTTLPPFSLPCLVLILTFFLFHFTLNLPRHDDYHRST